MTKQTHHCDGPGCEQVRGETNHWFAADTTATDSMLPALIVTSFEDAAAGAKHYCGEVCLIKAVSKYASDLKEKKEEL